MANVTVGGAKRRWICDVYSGYTCLAALLSLLQEVEVIKAVQDFLQKTLEQAVEQIR